MPLLSRSALRKADLREANQRLLLGIIRQNPETSRADIVRITGFSPSSVTYIVNRMIRDGLLSEVRDEAHARVGRRPLILRLRPEALLVAGVEIERSGARVALAGVDGAVLKERSIGWHSDPRVYLSRVRDGIRAVAGGVPNGRLLGVGVSLSGTVERESGRILAAENLGWFDVEAGRILSQGMAAQFYFENDSKLRALAERWFCEPGTKPLSNFVFVALRPGLGTGVVIDGKLLQGAHGLASEFGHTTLYPEGRRCLCGGRGCWEEYASQRALERLYSEKRAQKETPPVEAEEILRRARAGDAVAFETIRETSAYVGIGLANVNAVFNPEAIVLGDYLASGWDLMRDLVWETLRSRAPNSWLKGLRIVPSRHGRDSALKGSLGLVLSHYFAEPGSVPADNSRGNDKSGLRRTG